VTWLSFLKRIDAHICDMTLFFGKTRYGVAAISRLLKIIGFFCKRALWKRLYSAKETWIFKEPTKRSHPIWSIWMLCIHMCDAFICVTTHSYVSRRIHMCHDAFICVTKDQVWLCHTYKWVMSLMHESCHTWMSCITRQEICHMWMWYGCVVSHVNGSCRTCMSHVTYELGMLHMDASCQVWMRRVTYRCVMSSKNESCRRIFSSALGFPYTKRSCGTTRSFCVWEKQREEILLQILKKTRQRNLDWPPVCDLYLSKGHVNYHGNLNSNWLPIQIDSIQIYYRWI